MELDKSPNKYLIFKTKKKIKASFYLMNLNKLTLHTGESQSTRRQCHVTFLLPASLSYLCVLIYQCNSIRTEEISSCVGLDILWKHLQVQSGVLVKMKTADKKKWEKGHNTSFTYLCKKNVIMSIISHGLVQIITISPAKLCFS